MSSTSLPDDLSALIARQSKAALESGSAFFYPSDIYTVEDIATDANVPLQWSVRRCEALLEKAREKKRKEASQGNAKADTSEAPGGQNPSDVFAPPYDKHLLIAELGDHTLLLNKFALIQEHFLLVTREFRSQTVPPSPSTISLSFRILSSLPSNSPDDLLCFFNCGPDSGASQPHCHMQFVNLIDGGGVLVERLLDRIQRDGKEMETVHALPLPYQHFVHLLSPGLSTSPPEAIEAVLGQVLMQLLDAMFSAKAAAAALDAPVSRGKGASWNLLLTKRAMHLIPREQEDYPLDKEGEPHEEVGPLSLNALCFAGHLVTKSQEEVERIKAYPGGIRSILSKVGRKPVGDFTVASTSGTGDHQAE